MSGGGRLDIVTEQDEVLEKNTIEDNDLLKEINYQLQKLNKQMEIITGECLKEIE